MIVWVIAGLLGLATGLRIGWALVNKQSLVSSAMILSLGSLGVVAALNWQPLALLIDTVVHWPNIAVALSQVALVACAAGSCVMITTASSGHTAALTRRIALIQYGVAGVVAVISLVIFFWAGRLPEMSPSEYLQRNATSWLLPLLYVFLALTLVAWAGLRYSNRSRRGRALFLFTVGMVLIVAASGFLLLRAAGRTEPVGVGAAATMLGCAMVIVAAGSLLPSVEDWFGARQELRTIKPLLSELARRQPDVGIGVRPRGPLVFRVAERMSLISDALYLEATAADERQHETAAPRGSGGSSDATQFGDIERPHVTPAEQAQAVAQWIYDTREGDEDSAFPGLAWLSQPESYSDREWILAIAEQYRELDRRATRS
ncbi:hypothetical protein A5717_24630 [Mycolicibacterium porcinum]|uniref:hypothetical protein n=1 Tax=Mycolicibacterium porcinum TaxID=39693 RepID=UPI00080B2C6F|nr:hypothetical protein [Mycolicibacterium porcinum]OCB09612.1 hypothetical protein A5717_24630 [Mycolicibacterium porcinum]